MSRDTNKHKAITIRIVILPTIILVLVEEKFLVGRFSNWMPLKRVLNKLEAYERAERKVIR
jgi:hypothetical protein